MGDMDEVCELEVGDRCPVDSCNKSILAKGVLTHKFTRISSIESTPHSQEGPSTTIAGMPWRLTASREVTRNGAKSAGPPYTLGLFVECNFDSNSNMWAVEAIADFHASHARDDGVPYHDRSQMHYMFDSSAKGWGKFRFLNMNLCELAESTEYVLNDSLEVTVVVYVLSVKGLRLVLPRPSFDQPTELTDAELVLGDDARVVHVNKNYLACYSSYFRALFFGKFNESGQGRVALPDVDADDFVHLLNVIAPHREEVDKSRAAGLLALADRFDIPTVINLCEQVLTVDVATMTPSEDLDPLVTRIILADRYQLPNLHDACLRKLDKIQLIKRLRAKDEYKQLSDGTKLSLFDKMCKLVP